ncbi:MAG: isochorismatase family protein [Limimaricola sp.]|uniref:cysteine hydrolase family protein n=1 Tax=Limimaricola sp. TaxID=2211665 RepID=UPI001D3642E2|nr:cysteine hydrolase family protein [Limimaricola sp.]MBI1417498.1 isochorismatase family protein [Limimaricola sp.]
MNAPDPSPRNEALVLIDFQRGFDDPWWGPRNNPEAEDNALRLLAAFRQQGLAVFHVRHLSTEAGSPLAGQGARFKDGFGPVPGEVLIEKTVNSAFIGTDLEAQLRKREIGHLTICGLTTPHCVSTTTRMAANLGWPVTLVHDACAAFARNADTSFDNGPAFAPEEIHRAALAQLHGEFANVTATDAVLGRITGDMHS